MVALGETLLNVVLAASQGEHECLALVVDTSLSGTRVPANWTGSSPDAAGRG